VYTDYDLDDLLKEQYTPSIQIKITKSRGKLIKWQKILVKFSPEEEKNKEKEHLRLFLSEHRKHLKNVVSDNKGRNMTTTTGARLKLIGNAIRNVAVGNLKEKLQGIGDVVGQSMALVPSKIVIPVVAVGVATPYIVEIYNHTLGPIVKAMSTVKDSIQKAPELLEQGLNQIQKYIDDPVVTMQNTKKGIELLKFVIGGPK